MTFENTLFTSFASNERVLIFLLSGLTILLFYLIRERLLLNRNRSKIKIRVHVNGTRGKSSTTRLVAAVLRSKYPTVAKTTGTLPRRLLEDGSEIPIIRIGSANISEQIKTLIWAGKRDAEAIVLECMALRPEYQALCEREIIQATIAVITNIRADHLDVMGPGVEDVGWALAGIIPQNGILITAELNYLYLLKEACRQKNAQLISISDVEINAISDQMMARFDHLEHKDNVAIALKIADHCGITQSEAWDAMLTAQPDPGALMAFSITKKGPLKRSWHFVNAFAANDPESSLTIWNQAISSFTTQSYHVALFNLRDDRVDRTRQMADLALQLQSSQLILLMGNGSKLFLDQLASKVSTLNKVVDLGDASGTEVAAWLNENLNYDALVVALGNIGGQGFNLVETLKHAATSCSSSDFYLKNATFIDESERIEGELVYD